MSIIYLLLGHDKYKKVDKMLFKVVILSLAIISGQDDTSIAESLNADL